MTVNVAMHPDATTEERKFLINQAMEPYAPFRLLAIRMLVLGEWTDYTGSFTQMALAMEAQIDLDTWAP